LTGDENRFIEVVDDICIGFDNNVNLFSQRTELGLRQVTVPVFKTMLKASMSNVFRESIDRSLWLEDGTLILCSLMYDVTIFVWNKPMGQWVMFNENGSRG
jgi:hypothetical protein